MNPPIALFNNTSKAMIILMFTHLFILTSPSIFKLECFNQMFS